MAVKHFQSAPREEEAEVLTGLLPREFTLPQADLPEGGEPRIYTAVKPKDAVWARAAAASSKRTPIHLRVAAMLDFFEAALIPADRQAFRDRFEDPEDKLDLADVAPVVAWLAEEWRVELAAKQPAGNRATRRATGRPRAAAR